MKILKIEQQHFSGNVYNFSTVKSHTYFANGVCVHNCHENSTTKGTHAHLGELLYQLRQLPHGIELSVGGGNALAHPGLISFLIELKQRGFIANITINQMHIKPYYNTIIQLINDDLVKGVGISIVNNDFAEIIELQKLTNNIVFHVIIGIHSPETVDKLIELGGAKILLLGYKRFGRGINFYSRSIKNGIAEWYKNIHKYIGKCVLSFDNLAIEQLELKRVFTDEGWGRFYMGDDFCYTMYIDAVKEEYAPTSRSSEGRVGFGEMCLLDYFKTYRGTYEKID